MIKKIILLIFLFSSISLYALLAVNLELFISAKPAKAADDVWKIPELQIKFSDKIFVNRVECQKNVEGGMECKVPWIADYIAAIYKYAIGIVGILAVVVMMFGGLVWIMSAGNTSRVGEARAWITASITGLVLVLASYTILYIINPNLVNLNFLSVPVVKEELITSKAISGCKWTTIPKDQYCADVLGSGWVNRDGDKCAGEAPNWSDVCCCPPCPTECAAVGCEYCGECSDCITLKIPTKDGDMVNADLAIKLTSAYNDPSGRQNWRVTEAWPPAGQHASSCHKNGRCVDVNLTISNPTADDVKILYQSLVKSGLNPVYEAANCEPYRAVGVNCNAGSEYTNGSHFHVNP